MINVDDPETIFINSQTAYRNAYHELPRLPWADHPLPELVLDFADRLKTINPNPHILDFGCGDGTKSEKLANMGLTVVGMDYENMAVNRARQRINGDSDRLSFRQGDGRKIGGIFKENEFDGIFDYQCLASIPYEYWPQVIEGFYKIIKPGGYLMIDFLNRASKDFNGKITQVLDDHPGYVFKTNPLEPKHIGLEWENGLYVYFINPAEIENDFGDFFTIIDKPDRLHPRSNQRILTAALLQSKKR